MTTEMVREGFNRRVVSFPLRLCFAVEWYAVVRESTGRKALSDKDGTRMVRGGTQDAGTCCAWYVKVRDPLGAYHAYHAYLPHDATFHGGRQ